MLISPGAQNQTSRSLIPAFGILGFWATKPLDQTVATQRKKWKSANHLGHVISQQLANDLRQVRNCKSPRD